MRIAICDDRKEECLSLQALCQKCSTVANIKFSIFTSGLDLLNEPDFDIVFLDVDMPEINGIETGKRLRQFNKNCVIIFVTAHPEYAIDAFDCGAFHYLLKPCDEKKLTEVLHHASSRLDLLKQYHVIRLKDKILSIPLSDIWYIECSDRHVVYHTVNEDIRVRSTIQNVYNSVRQSGFCLVHQGYIVNIDKIKTIEKDELILQDDRRIPISRRKKSEISIEYMKHVEKYKR